MSVPASAVHVPDLQRLLPHEPLYASYLRECCGEQPHVALSYMADMFQRVWVLETSQHAFFQLMLADCSELVATSPHPTSDGVRRAGLLVLLAGQDWPRRGFYLLPYATAVPLVLRSLMLYQADSLLDAPRSLVRPAFHPGQYPACVRTYLMQHWLKEHSSDRRFGADDQRLSLLSSESFLCYDDHIIQQFSSLNSEQVQLVRIDDVSAKLDAPYHLQLAQVTLDRVLATAHQYLSYQIATLPSEALRRLQAAGLVTKLFPIVLALMRGNTIEPRQPLVQQLWHEHNAALQMLVGVAKDVQMFAGQLNAQKLEHPQLPLLMSLYKRTYALGEYNTLYLDIRSSMLLNYGKPESTTRWLYMPSEEQSFCEFVLDHTAQYLDSEQREVELWLRCECLLSVDVVQLQRGYLANDAAAASTALAELSRLDEQFAVLRFPRQSVRLSELELSMQAMMSSHAALLHASKRPGDDSMYSRVFTCGADARGAYLLILRDYLLLLKQAQLAETMSSHRYHKNMPCFPVLARFWLGTHGSTPEPRSRPQDRAKLLDSAIQQAQVPSWFLDAHAQDCVVQVLCHQLQLNTDNEVDLDRMKRKKRTRGNYVPRLNDPEFPVLVRLLNRLTGALASGAERLRVDDFPNMDSIHAVRQFLELRRPRQARPCTLRQPPTADPVSFQEAPAPSDPWVPVEDAGQWYEDLLRLPAERVYQMLCDPLDRYVTTDRFQRLQALPITYMHAVDTPLQHHGHMRSYMACFNSAYTQSRVSLAPRYAEEPVSALVNVLRYVEAQNSAPRLMRPLIASIHLEAREFFGNPSKGLLNIRAQLPMQARAARDPNTQFQFVFYETSLAVLVLTAAESAHVEQRAADTQPELPHHVPVESVFLDMVLRFRRYIQLFQIASKDNAAISWYRLSQAMENTTTTAQVGDVRFYRSVDTLREHLLSLLSEKEAAKVPPPRQETPSAVYQVVADVTAKQIARLWRQDD